MPHIRTFCPHVRNFLRIETIPRQSWTNLLVLFMHERLYQSLSQNVDVGIDLDVDADVAVQIDAAVDIDFDGNAYIHVTKLSLRLVQG